MFRVGDRVRHLGKGMATVVCVNSSVEILLKLDFQRGSRYQTYKHQYKIIAPEAGNWYWYPSVEMCDLVSRKSSFKGNAK